MEPRAEGSQLAPELSHGCLGLLHCAHSRVSGTLKNRSHFSIGQHIFYLKNYEAHRVSMISSLSESTDYGVLKLISKNKEWD